jgi:hypothetical protein
LPASGCEMMAKVRRRSTESTRAVMGESRGVVAVGAEENKLGPGFQGSVIEESESGPN